MACVESAECRIKLRNPTIAKLFRYVGIAENAGYGMKKLASWEQLTGAKPIVESDRTIATVTLPLKSAIQNLAMPNNVGDAKNDAKNLTERQQQIIALISGNLLITRAEIASAIGFSVKTIERELSILSEIVSYVGSKKGGHWEIQTKSNRKTSADPEQPVQLV